MKIIEKIMKKRLMNDQSGFILAASTLITLGLGFAIVVGGFALLMWLMSNLMSFAILLLIIVIAVVFAKKFIFTGEVGRITGEALRKVKV
jgi:hypothetical protein